MARGILRWTGKALLWLVVVLLTVDVGDHELHIDCVGQGSPTVVLEAALGNASAHWVRVQQEVSEVTRVCAYDRAGMGWSEGGPEPRDAARVTGELHALLEGAGVEGPYVMVGHSFGGLYARAYAARYPDETAGVVLVDSSHLDQFERLPDGPENYAQARRLFAVAPLFARLGVIRLFDLLPVPAELPAPQRAQVEAFNPATKQVSTTADEFRATPQTTAQVRDAGSLGDKPLAVVSAGKQPQAWLQLQEELATLSPNSTHRVVEGATHVSLLYDPDDARETSTSIVRVVEAARNDQPLAQ
jgi:pimeloyl-ACP methyl ester carboxylesterase